MKASNTFLIGLLGTLLAASGAWAVWPFDGNDERPNPANDLGGAAASILSEAIRIRTVSPRGNERPLAELLVRILTQAGVEARVIETPSDGSSKGRAAAWARLPGTGKERPLVLLSHLDVVPAQRDGWVVSPFSGTVAGGYVVGRGALDAKGVAVVHLLTVLELARRNEALDRDIIFLATPGEETGGKHGAGHLVSDRPELLHDAEYLLTEGGGILDAEGSGPNIWGVTVTEKSPCWLQLVARGQPGHGSTASPDAAIPRLVRALERVRQIETEIRVTPEVARMFAGLADAAPEADRFALRNLAFSLDADPEFRGRFLAKPAQNALVRNTLAITVIDGGARTNMVPATASAQIDARLLSGESCDELVARLEHEIDDPALEIRIMLSVEPAASPAESELFEAIRLVASEIDPDALVVPRTIAGFTDAHYFRDIGVVSYGFVPRWLTASESSGIHGPNERISIQNLERGVRTLVQILEKLAGSG
jgi:acetylornithine deacetylase/succinyl-diaminopimelate desuccinylase-like protein